METHTEPPDPYPNNLSVIPQGNMGAAEAHSLKTILTLLARQGKVETLHPKNLGTPNGMTETWFRDTQTEVIYRLIEKGGEDNWWERVPRTELQPNIQ